jgi:hypothetical protein
MNWTPLVNAFKDPNGDFNVAEGIAALGALSNIGVPLHNYIAHGVAPDLIASGTALGLIITAVAAARRFDPVRDRDRGDHQ